MRVGSIPPITSATAAIEGSSRSRANSVGEQAVGRARMAGGVAHQRRAHRHRSAGHALDRIHPVGQQPVHGGAHGAEAEQADLGALGGRAGLAWAGTIANRAALPPDRRQPPAVELYAVPA